MGEWPNPDKVDEKELVGRRLLEEPYVEELGGLVLKPNHFVDTRFEEDLSIDRIGVDGRVNKQARRELSRLAHRLATQNSDSFFGWCTCRVDHLNNKSYAVVATPDKTDDDEQYWNHYHADISRAEHRDKRRAYELATVLAHIFSFQTQDAGGKKLAILTPL